MSIKNIVSKIKNYVNPQPPTNNVWQTLDANYAAGCFVVGWQ